LNLHTGIYQLSRDQRNVYYHALKDCVSSQFGDINVNIHMRIEQSTKENLSDVHLQHLLHEFELHL